MSETPLLLQQWLNGIRIAQIAHLRAAAHYGKLNQFLGVPVTILSVAVGTSIFTMLASSDKQGLLICVGTVSMVSAILSGLQTFLNYGELAIRHRMAGNGYGKLRRRFEELIEVEREAGEFNATLGEIRAEWDRLDQECPGLPQKFQDAALKVVTPARAKELGFKTSSPW